MDYYLIANRNTKDRFTTDILRWVLEQAKLYTIDTPTGIQLSYRTRPENTVSFIDTKVFERIIDYEDRACQMLKKADGVIFVGTEGRYLDPECVTEVTYALSLGLSIKTIILP